MLVRKIQNGEGRIDIFYGRVLKLFLSYPWEDFTNYITANFPKKMEQYILEYCRELKLKFFNVLSILKMPQLHPVYRITSLIIDDLEEKMTYTNTLSIKCPSRLILLITKE